MFFLRTLGGPFLELNDQPGNELEGNRKPLILLAMLEADGLAGRVRLLVHFRDRWRSVKLSDEGRGLVPRWIEHWRRRRKVAGTVVGVMDRDNWAARTDNIVVIEPRRRRLFWIPRDLWAPAMFRDAFRRGGLQARMQGAIEGRGTRNLRVVLRGIRSVLRSLVISGRSPSAQRRQLIRAWPLVVVGGVAYCIGALTASHNSGAD